MELLNAADRAIALIEENYTGLVVFNVDSVLMENGDAKNLRSPGGTVLEAQDETATAQSSIDLAAIPKGTPPSSAAARSSQMWLFVLSMPT